MNKLLVIVLAGLFCSPVHASESSESLIELLVTAKATGMCGAIKQLSSFQETTKMPGGDEFLLRFLNTEAARLGKSLQQFLEDCQSSVKTYTDVMAELEKVK